MKINVNDTCRVKLTPAGLKRYFEYNAGCGPVVVNSEITIQLWELMRIFGPMISMGSQPSFINNTIEILES